MRIVRAKTNRDRLKAVNVALDAVILARSENKKAMNAAKRAGLTEVVEALDRADDELHDQQTALVTERDRLLAAVEAV